MSLVHLICGYKGTGKDDLHLSLTGNKLPRKYLIFARGPSSMEAATAYTPPSPWDSFLRRTRLSFASPLKEIVHKELNLQRPVDPFFKDIHIHWLGYSLRDMYIITAGREKMINGECHFAEMLAKRVVDTSPDHVYDVTDFRFPEELRVMREKFNVVTTRVFRSSVSLPKSDDHSERSLDNLTTDYLVVPEEDVEEALALFPQYEGFVRVGRLK